MMRIFLAIVFCCLLRSGMAADTLHIIPSVEEHAAVLAELIQRSGLPKDELNGFLADCNSNQQNLYFCAWRDQISAERKLRIVVAAKEGEFPQCTDFIEAKVAGWARVRNKSCAHSAAKEWGDGTMKPTAEIICITAEIIRMTERMKRMKKCETR